jgi:hypothetical protein
LEIYGSSLRGLLVSGESLKNRVGDQIMVAYEFYWLDSKGGYEILGVLPERRKHSERLTQESITHWGENFFGKNLKSKGIFFIQVTIDDTTGRIFRATPFAIPRKEVSE